MTSGSWHLAWQGAGFASKPDSLTPDKAIENMNRRIRFLLASLALGTALLSLAATAREDRAVTRTLQRSVDVPTGDSVAVENLVGHMRVTQGNGPLQITATVVAGGDQAQTLMQSVKLDVTTAGKQVRVHVSYPVDRYDTFLYVPANSRAEGSDELCILGKLICFHGRSSSTFEYQGKRVRVNESSSGGSGVPLYVDVVVRLPAHVSASFSNTAGLLKADGLANHLSLATQGGDIHAQSLSGQLHARSDGGDIYLSDVTSSNAQVDTGGGDLTGSSVTGDISLATGGGDAKLGTLAGKLSLTSGGGDARLSGNLSSLESLRAEMGGGDLTVSGNLTALKLLNAASGGGDLVFRASNLSMHLDAASGGGDISVHLPDTRNVNSSSDHFSGDIGNAAGEGTLRAGGGDISVTQL